MARTQGVGFWKSQGHRRLAPRRAAPAQVAAFGIAAFLIGVGTAGADLSAFAILAFAFAAASALFFWKRSWPAAALVLFACAAGIFYYHLYFAVRAARTAVPLSETSVFAGYVAAEPGHGPKSEYFPLRLAEPHRGTIRIVAPPGSGFGYGDELELRGVIESPEKERDLPVAFFPKIERSGADGGWAFRRALFGFKSRLVGTLSRYLPAEEAAFLAGITLGEKADFSPEFIQALAASGTTHLVALSGYNIAILVVVVFGGFLAFLGRRAAFYATTMAILLFVLMVGAEPSVVRAAAMGFLMLLAREIGRPYGLPYALLWTALLMVLWNPGALFMPGFQLSFMALLGIVYLSPVVSTWLGANPDGATAGALPAVLSGFRANAALTIAAQAAVAPIILANFGGVSLTAVLANALILPFIPMTMFFGFMLVACGLVFPSLGVVAAAAAHVFLAYETGVIRFFAVFNLPVGGALPWFGVLFYYLMLAALVRRHETQNREHGRA